MIREAALCSCCLLLPTKPVFVIVLPLRRSLHPSLAVSAAQCSSLVPQSQCTGFFVSTSLRSQLFVSGLGILQSWHCDHVSTYIPVYPCTGHAQLSR